MKYLVLLALLVGCGEESWQDRVKNEAILFCSCHKGVDSLSFNAYALALYCKDGSNTKINGDITTVGFEGGCADESN